MNDLPPETGTIVIGGGTGGAACAGLLAEHGTEPVLLLEAGPDYGALIDGRWPAELLDARYIPLSHDWGLDSGSALPGRVLDFPRARVMGGCSAHNGCTAALGARTDYDAWEADGNEGWGSKDMTPLLEMVRERFRVRTYSMDELTPIQAAFVSAGQSVGLPFADDLDTLEAGVGTGPMAANIVNGVRWNSSFAFIDPVRSNPLLRIAGNVLVERLIVERGVVKGVVAIRDGTRAEVRAARVIVCAGVYGTPALLLRSGIGPAADATRLGIAVVADLPGVGENLLDHVCAQMDFRGSSEFATSLTSRGWSPDEQCVARARSSRCDDGPYDIHVFMVAGANSGHPNLPPISMYGGAMKARSAGRVTLRDSNPESLPLVNPRYLTDPEGHDQAVLLEARELMAEISREAGLAKLLGPLATGGELVDSVVNYCHPAGTCKLGPPDDPNAVVGPDGAVHGIDGLHVADASLMPSITRGNINLPTAAIAARVVCLLLGIEPARLRQGAEGQRRQADKDTIHSHAVAK
jgi:choline dehydrogenase-like flavoprotein